MKKYLALIGIFFLVATHAQEVTLDSCYEMAHNHFPAYNKLELAKKSTDLMLENSQKAWLPQAQISGRATYQTEVTQLPNSLPNLTIEPLSKDQYKVQAEINQMIYDGGKIKLQQEQLLMNQLIQSQEVELTLYNLKERVAQLYFGILLYQKQLAQRELLEQNIASALEKAEVALKNGVTFKSTVNELKAELISAQMATEEILQDKIAAQNMLSALIGTEITNETKLITPQEETLALEISRPELHLFDLQKQKLEIQQKSVKQHWFPIVSAFVQGGYGRPGLNMLKNSFEPFAIGGIQFQLPLTGFYTKSNDLQLIEIQSEQIETEKESFLLNTKISLEKEKAEIQKYENLLLKDEEVINLRNEVVTSAEAQLKNGVITSHEYITKLNTAHTAQITKNLHEILLLKSKENLKNLMGN